MRANPYNWIVLQRGYRAEERMEVEERARLYICWGAKPLAEPPCTSAVTIAPLASLTSPKPSYILPK